MHSPPAHRLSVVLAAAAIAAACSSPVANPPPATATSGAIVFEGARLITGEDTSPIDNSAFIVERGKIVAVGRKGGLTLPPGAARVDLSGKTVMPAMIDVHSHLGFLDMANGTMSKANFNRENLTDHLQRYAYIGVAATCSFGTDFGDLPFRMRDEVIPNAARYRTVGRGLAWPGSGPTDPSRNDVPYAVKSEADARAAVRDLAPMKPDFVKIWVDDRGGSAMKMTPPILRAAADEATRLGFRSVGHTYDLSDAKELLKAGVEGFTHMVRDQEIDDEYMALVKARPNVWITPNLGGINLVNPPEDRTAWLDEPMTRETVPPALIELRRAAITSGRGGRGGGGRTSGGSGFQVPNTKKLKAAGVRIVVGSDAAGDANRWLGPMTLMELENFVAAGFTPAETIVAATREAADVLRLDDLGTIAPGKSADFIVLGANPLDDIKNVRAIDRVYLRGQEVDRSGLRAKWQAQFAKAAKPTTTQ